MKSFLNKTGHDLLASTNIFDYLKDLIFLMETDEKSFRYVYVNSSAMKVLKFDGDIIGSLIEEKLPDELAKVLIPKYQQVQATKKSVDFIQILESENGEFVAEASLNPILTENGQCKYILAIVRDITERNCKERELKETKRNLEMNQKRLNSLVEHNDDAVYEMDLQGKFIHINKAFTKISAFHENELIGSTFLHLILEEKKEEVMSHFMNALKGRKEEYETWIRNKNGQLVQLLVKNVPIIVDGNIVGIYGIASDITEKNKIGHLLLESEQRYKSLFENHPDAIFSYDLEGNLTSGNDGVELISGFSKEEFLGTSFVSMMAPEHVGKTLYHFDKTIRDKKSESYEVALLHKDGHRVELFVMSIPIIINNQVTGIYGLAKDVTDINRTKEELEIFWNYTIDPIFYFSDGQILKVNPAFEKTFGYSEKEVTNNMDLIIPPSLRHEIKEIDAKIRKGETIISHETIRTAKSGENLDIIASYTPVKDENGLVVGATAFYKDISVLKKVDQELQDSQEKYKLITENVFDIIHLINPSGIVEYVSPSNESILGYTYSEYVGQPLTAYIHPVNIPTLEKGFKRLKGGGKPAPYELKVRHKKGHYIWMEATTTPVVENGVVKQLVTIARDITERKRTREELAKMAFYDYLTGLPNRRTFDERLNTAILQANRSKKKVAVMMLDGRKFKQINDTFGHDAGDAVIKEMSKRTQASVRQTDTVARLGGDEIGIVLPEIESEDVAEVVAERILNSLLDPFYVNNSEIFMGAGIGISFYPDHSVDKKQLMKFADEAMYEAKKTNQNEYRIYKENVDKLVVPE
ncbi:PAS domain S-box protein [Paenisporosarcina indica]|uniref:PAS domain S-box protein n=1 Tax=Paenisporosarcina indica TaxID=650093 RepID=UPI0009502B48|nr:PAS domain S-box protein [Paenisporosarcina indica]